MASFREDQKEEFQPKVRDQIRDMSVLFILRSLVLHGPSTQANVDKFGVGRCRVYGKEAGRKQPVSRKEIGV